MVEPQSDGYCLGFLLDIQTARVLLIRKTRPEWQAGKLNGVGGSIEKGESFQDAMEREFKEEAGVAVTGWAHFASLRGSGWFVACFSYKWNSLLEPMNVRTTTDEQLEWVKIASLFRDDIIPNLTYLIPLSFDRTLKLPIIIQEA